MGGRCSGDKIANRQARAFCKAKLAKKGDSLFSKLLGHKSKAQQAVAYAE
jgi:hypothetical protein